jgi:hypothetical protein
MRVRLLNRASLVCAVALTACSSEPSVAPDSIPGSLTKPAPVLTTLRVTPETMAIQPGSTEQLSIAALDQTGAPMDISGVTYTTDVPGIAQVSDQGVVTGLASGTARITATVRVGLSAKFSQVTAFVRDSVAFPDVVLTYGTEGWSPFDAKAAAGSVVVWRFDPSITGSSAGKIYVMNDKSVVIDSVFLRGSPALRRFETPGTFMYCLTGCLTRLSGKVTVQ